jgi:hypothetical protein
MDNLESRIKMACISYLADGRTEDTAARLADAVLPLVQDKRSDQLAQATALLKEATDTRDKMQAEVMRLTTKVELAAEVDAAVSHVVEALNGKYTHVAVLPDEGKAFVGPFDTFMQYGKSQAVKLLTVYQEPYCSRQLKWQVHEYVDPGGKRYRVFLAKSREEAVEKAAKELNALMKAAIRRPKELMKLYKSAKELNIEVREDVLEQALRLERSARLDAVLSAEMELRQANARLKKWQEENPV